MSTSVPVFPNHRLTRNAGFGHPAASPQHSQTSDKLNRQTYESNPYSGMMYPPQPTTPPRTPRKSDNNSTAKTGTVVTGTGGTSKSRSKGKNRPKNVATSPAVSRSDRYTTSLTEMQPVGPASARPISTPSTTAYAGPTFHASPAPSALPIPSFYSKSFPDSPSIKPRKTHEEEPPQSNNESALPSNAQILANQIQQEESPLDFFFKADREEKARTRSTSSFRGSRLEGGAFPPPFDSPRSAHTSPAPAPSSQERLRATHFAGGSSSAMFAMELDGNTTHGQPYGPAFSTPYSERINAARIAASSFKSAQTSEQLQKTDRSEALKAYLFSGNLKNPSAPGEDSLNPETQSSIATIPNISSRGKSETFSGPRSAEIPNRPPHSSYSSINDSVTSYNSPRGNSRASGLRQQITPTKTPTRTPDQIAPVCTDSPSSSQAPIIDSNFTSQGQRHNLDDRGLGSFISTSPSGTPIENRDSNLQGMEDSLRRMLKLGPSSDSVVRLP